MKKLMTLALLGALFASAGCERRSPLEKAADKVGDAVEDAGDAIKDAVDK